MKVYLLGYKYACNPDPDMNFTNENLARTLGLLPSDVIKAWDYWEKKGIIKRHYKKEDQSEFSIEFLSLKQLYIDNYNSISNHTTKGQRDPYSPSDLVQAMQDDFVRDMFNSIQQIMCRPLNPTESLQCLEWLYDLKMAPEIIEEAFRYSVEKRGVKNIRYINTIINNWYDNNINTKEKLDQHLENTDNRYSRYKKVMEAMGRNKNPSRIEKEFMDKWFDIYNMPMDVILKACDTAIIQKSDPSLNYIDGILTKCHKDNIRSVKDIPVGSKGVKHTKRKTSKNKFHNFDQPALKLTNEQLKEILNRHKDA